MKIIWGIIVGMVAVVMISASGIDGIKALSNLGGLSALFIELALLAAVLVMIMKNPSKYDTHKKDYDSEGRVIPKITKFKKLRGKTFSAGENMRFLSAV